MKRGSDKARKGYDNRDEVAYTNLTLSDLPPNEKAKVARLVDRLVSIGHENETLTKELKEAKEQHTQTIAALDSHIADKMKSLEENRELLTERLINALGLLQVYQTKVDELSDQVRVKNRTTADVTVMKERYEEEVLRLQELMQSQQETIQQSHMRWSSNDALIESLEAQLLTIKAHSLEEEAKRKDAELMVHQLQQHVTSLLLQEAEAAMPMNTIPIVDSHQTHSNGVDNNAAFTFSNDNIDSSQATTGGATNNVLKKEMLPNVDCADSNIAVPVVTATLTRKPFYPSHDDALQRNTTTTDVMSRQGSKECDFDADVSPARTYIDEDPEVNFNKSKPPISGNTLSNELVRDVSGSSKEVSNLSGVGVGIVQITESASMFHSANSGVPVVDSSAPDPLQRRSVDKKSIVFDTVLSSPTLDASYNALFSPSLVPEKDNATPTGSPSVEKVALENRQWFESLVAIEDEKDNVYHNNVVSRKLMDLRDRESGTGASSTSVLSQIGNAHLRASHQEKEGVYDDVRGSASSGQASTQWEESGIYDGNRDNGTIIQEASKQQVKRKKVVSNVSKKQTRRLIEDKEGVKSPKRESKKSTGANSGSHQPGSIDGKHRALVEVRRKSSFSTASLDSAADRKPVVKVKRRTPSIHNNRVNQPFSSSNASGNLSAHSFSSLNMSPGPVKSAKNRLNVQSMSMGHVDMDDDQYDAARLVDLLESMQLL